MNNTIIWTGAIGAMLLSPAALAEPGACAAPSYFEADHDRSIADCSLVLPQASSDKLRSIILTRRGEAYSSKRDGTHALADFAEAIRLDPANEDGYYYRASYYKIYGDRPELALADLTTAINIAPRNTAALMSRAELNAELGHFEDATADYTAAIALGGTYQFSNLERRGDVWRARGDYWQALDDYAAVLKLEADFAPAKRDIAAAHAVLAIGPALEPAAPPVSERDFQRVSAPTLARYQPELWSWNGKPHHCSVSQPSDQPVAAIGRSAAGYVLTLSSTSWHFQPQASYSVTVAASDVEQVAQAIAVDSDTIAIPLKAEERFLSKWRKTTTLQVRTPTTKIPAEYAGGSYLDSLDACWMKVASVAAANPFDAPAPSSPPGSNPFAPAPATAPESKPLAPMPEFMRRLLAPRQ